VKKLLIVLLLLASACQTTNTVIPPTSAAAGPRPALDQFLAAVRTQDLQAMSAAWGNKEGPVRESRIMTRDEVERRELILMCYFRHDRYRVLGEQPAPNDERVMQVELTKGTISRTTNFFLVQGRDRWFVRSADMEPVRDLCANRGKDGK
jgi:hypothetical protein